ncbi:MAG: hypothetical protein M0Q53_20420 [Prolixibacteraceae bacterium]|jgi:hypothetical protein|nr:hypothetical protein [Prolixibacteraceae bacterium]
MKKYFLALGVLGIMLVNMIMFDFNKEKSFYSRDAVACESMVGIEYSIILLMDECLYWNGSTWRIGCVDSSDTCGAYDN